jgi:hypothetical protein
MKRHGLVETKQPNMSQTMARGALQRKANGAAASMQASPLVHRMPRSPGDPIDPDIRSLMEPRFGHDFSRVRVHTDAEAAASARAVSARAYTVGRDVVFGNGRYAPKTSAGRHLLAHELAHVVQQSGDTLSSSNDLSIAPASDGVEAEARSAAAIVASGGTFRPQIRSGIAVARQPDAGVPVDAGPSRGPDAGVPADAGPSSGPAGGPTAPGPTPAPQAPAGSGGPAAPAPGVTATIAGVTFGSSANRIPPTQTATAAVTVTGLPAGGSVNIDVEGSGGGNGTATITAGAVLTGSGSVTVRGDDQTARGNAGKLNLRATVGSTVVGRSPGFTVAAWPTNFAISRNADVDDGKEVGVAVNTGWISDGSGSRKELKETEYIERVDIARRDNPPFTTPGPTSATYGTSGFIAGNSAFIVDTHTRLRSIIDTHALSTGVFTQVYRQNFLFNDYRTGVTNMVVPNSGFTITHSVYVLGSPGKNISAHDTVKTGAAVSVEGRAATAGTGKATSNSHYLG